MRTTRNSAENMGILKQLADNAIENVHASVSERAANRRSLAQDRKIAKQEMQLEEFQAEQQKYNDFIESILIVLASKKCKSLVFIGTFYC